MPNKDRVLCLLQILRKETDDETWLATEEIRDRLKAEGVKCTVRTLRTDIKALRNSGIEIGIEEKDSEQTRYCWKEREWSVPELQVLIDAVSSAQFIPKKRSKELTDRLARMAGPSHTEQLRPQILISEHIKAKNRNMIYSVQEIRKAIDRNKKITFRYLKYTEDKKQVPRHEGTDEEYYVVSPYATVWNNDRYYLVGWSDKRNSVNVYRIDRMDVPKLTRQKQVPPPEDFDIRDYTDKVFWMYDGPKAEVTLRCKKEILDQVIDRFGESVNIKINDDDTFDVNVPVSVTGTFFAWVFQFTGEMRIIKPEYVKRGYTKYLREALDETLKE